MNNMPEIVDASLKDYKLQDIEIKYGLLQVSGENSFVV